MRMATSRVAALVALIIVWGMSAAEASPIVPLWYLQTGALTRGVDGSLGSSDDLLGQPDGRYTSFGIGGSFIGHAGTEFGGDGDPSTLDVLVWEGYQWIEAVAVWVAVKGGPLQFAGVVGGHPSAGLDLDHLFGRTAFFWVYLTDVGGIDPCPACGEAGPDIDAVWVRPFVPGVTTTSEPVPEVPEPSTVFLVGTVALGLAARRWVRR